MTGSSPLRGSGRRRFAVPVAAAGTTCLAGCGSESHQSTLSPASNASHDIANLWWGMMIGAWIVFAVVVLLLAIAILRRRAAKARGDEVRSRRLILLGGLVAPIVVLSVMFAFGVSTLPATSAPKKGNAALTIDVTGHQWFWEARYAGTSAVVANEIHIPVGRPVRVVVSTVDVIHSFWVPELNRKIDTIPGRRNEVLIQAKEAGVYRGQCAEYCGLQHAHMAFFVYADPPSRFRAWLADQARPAREPRTEAERAGRDVFLNAACAGCHTIRGTPAQGQLGPDLTHVASRSTLAALTIPNRPGYLGGWILDPQHIKPGNKMPSINLSGEQLQKLLDYLDSLK